MKGSSKDLTTIKQLYVSNLEHSCNVENWHVERYWEHIDTDCPHLDI